MPCRWGKVVIPDAVGTACRGMHSPKERLLLKACRCGKLPQMPAMLPGSECGRKIAAASRCLPLGKGRCPRCPAVGERSLSPMPCRWGKLPPIPAIPPKWERLYQSPLENHLSFRKHPRRNLCPSPPAARRYSCAEDSLRQPYFPSWSALYCTRPASAALKTMCRPA